MFTSCTSQFVSYFIEFKLESTIWLSHQYAILKVETGCCVTVITGADNRCSGMNYFNPSKHTQQNPICKSYVLLKLLDDIVL
jgi:hypothetical protein